MQRLSLVLFLCAAAAAVLAQDTPPADTQQEINVPTTPDGSAPAKVVLSVPISTPNGNRTLEFREGEDVQATINAFITSEGLGEVSDFLFDTVAICIIDATDVHLVARTLVPCHS